MKITTIYSALIIAAFFMSARYATAGPYIKIESVDAASNYPTVRVHLTVSGLHDEEAETLDDTHISVVEDGSRVIKGVSVTRQNDPDYYLCVVFSIDSSKSIDKKFMARIKSTARDMVKGLEERDRIALFRFNDRVVMMNDFTQNKDEIIRKINRIERHGTRTLLY
ncbi:MAG: VWA domain-containing protein, partial [Chrysiogenales bacterium]